jgi:cytochrome c
LDKIDLPFGFKYSSVIKALGGNWTCEDLNNFLSDPARVLPGTDMGTNESERADLIAYLRTPSDSPVALPGN